MEFEEISPNVWKPENKGDNTEGVLIRKESDVGVNNSRLYHLETADKKQISIWGSTVLDSRMDYVNEGEYIRITFKGTEKNKRNQDTKIFKVERGKTGGEKIEG